MEQDTNGSENFDAVVAALSQSFADLRASDAVEVVMDVAIDHCKKYETTGQDYDLKRAVTFSKIAMRMGALRNATISPASLGETALILGLAFRRYGQLSDLEGAINMSREALFLQPANSNNRLACLNTLATNLDARFRLLGQEADLEEAITMTREAVDLLPARHPHKAALMTNLALSLKGRFLQSGQTADIEEAITLSRGAVQLMSTSDSGRTSGLFNLETCLLARFTKLDQLADLEEAIAVGREARDLAASYDPNRPEILRVLGVLLYARYKRVNELADLEETIDISQKLDEPSSIHISDVAKQLEFHGQQLYSRYLRLNQSSDLNGAISKTLEALDLLTSDASERPQRLTSLGKYLHARFLSEYHAEDMDNAISFAQQALDLTTAIEADKVIQLDHLESLLTTRFEHQGHIADLEQAIRLTQDAISITPLHDSSRLERLSTLGHGIYTRFQRLGNLEDLEKAIAIGREVADLTNSGDSEKSVALDDLANRLEAQFDRTGFLPYLEESISKSEEAVALPARGTSSRAARLGNLASRLQTRFERLGQREDLEKAISKSQEAVDLASGDSHIRSGCLSNLGSNLRARFEVFGQLKDLEMAISLFRESYEDESARNDIFKKSGRLRNLGLCLFSRFQRSFRLEDLTEAIDTMEKAIKSTPVYNSERPLDLSNLALMIESRYDQQQELVDLERAVALTKKATEMTSNDDPEKPKRLNNLGKVLSKRFTIFREVADIESAIVCARQSLELTAQNDPIKASRRFNLALSLYERSRHLKSVHDFEEMILQLQPAWAMLHANPFHRVKAGTLLLLSLKVLERFTEALTLSKEIIELLPQVSTRALDHSDQLYVVSQFSGLGSDACSLHLICEKDSDTCVADALLLLEASRGTISGLAFDNRIDLASLQSSYPQQAAKFLRLRDALNRKSQTFAGDDTRMDNQNMSNTQLLQQFNECVKDIRCLPGHEDFLCSPSIEALKASASDGVIVYVNVSSIRSDAILVHTDSVRSITLPNLDYDRVRRFALKRASLFAFNNLEDEGKSNSKLRSFLKWLWDVCVSPILHALEAYPYPEKDSMRRVFWIGTGSASALPFHAAGDHTDGASQTTLGRVISSYVPSIRALSHAQTRALANRSLNNPRHNLLIACMATTPDAIDLPGTSDECHRIIQDNHDRVEVTLLEQPTASTVLEALQSHSVFHFAGHGSAHPIDAAKSCLIFQRFDETRQQIVQDALLIERMFDVDVHPAALAFLSACSTADNQVFALADEGLHLASAFLVAGFSNVVAAQWPTNDEVCVGISDKFYKQLKLGDSGSLNNGDAAKALHEAVKSARAQSPDCPIRWAAHVHMGV